MKGETGLTIHTKEELKVTVCGYEVFYSGMEAEEQCMLRRPVFYPVSHLLIPLLGSVRAGGSSAVAHHGARS